MTREKKREQMKIRAIKEAEYIIYYNASSRQTALEFNVSHSTVLKDMHRLIDINKDLYYKIMNILNLHKRRYKEKKKTKVYNGVRILGTRKGKVLKYEWFMTVNQPIKKFVTKKSVNRYIVEAPIEKYAGLDIMDIETLYFETILKYTQMGDN